MRVERMENERGRGKNGERGESADGEEKVQRKVSESEFREEGEGRADRGQKKGREEKAGRKENAEIGGESAKMSVIVIQVNGEYSLYFAL